MATSGKSRKSLRESIQSGKPSTEEQILDSGEYEDATLASQILWSMIIQGKNNSEACIWAARITSELALLYPAQYEPLFAELRKQLSEGLPMDQISKNIAEKSKEVWASYTEALVKDFCKYLLIHE